MSLPLYAPSFNHGDFYCAKFNSTSNYLRPDPHLRPKIDLSVGSVLALSAVVATSFLYPDTHSLAVPGLMGFSSAAR